jgi:hypothetical protein
VILNAEKLRKKAIMGYFNVLLHRCGANYRPMAEINVDPFPKNP